MTTSETIVHLTEEHKEEEPAEGASAADASNITSASAETEESTTIIVRQLREYATYQLIGSRF